MAHLIQVSLLESTPCMMHQLPFSTPTWPTMVPPDEVLAVLAATNTNKLAQVAAIVNVQAEVTTSLLKELAKDVLAAELLEVFLMVTVPEGEKAMVVTAARLAQYRPELGQVSGWTGKVFGFLGEVNKEGQLPP
jgi:hypothetical protein